MSACLELALCCRGGVLTSGEATLAGGKIPFPRPPPMKRASSEMKVVFGIVLLRAGRSPEVQLLPPPQKQK